MEYRHQKRAKRKGNITIVGALLDDLRKQKGFTWDTLADATGIAASTVSRILQGKSRHPSKKIIERLCDVLDVQDEDLREAIYNSYDYASSRQQQQALERIQQALVNQSPDNSL